MFTKLYNYSVVARVGRISFRSMSSSLRKLDGKVAIVTASTEGIGLAIARHLGQDGAKVMVSSRKQTNVDKAVEELKAEKLTVAGTVCHVSKAEDRQKLVQTTLSTFGGIDIVVSNAAANPAFGPILDTSESAWDKPIKQFISLPYSHLYYPRFCFVPISRHRYMQRMEPYQAKMPYCMEGAFSDAHGVGGSMIFVSSFAGCSPTQYPGAYSVSKTALLGLTKALVPQLLQSNIRVNAIAPGVIKTKFSEILWKDETVRNMFLKIIPMRRFGEPPECAGLVSFLASDDASYITGECVVVSGGIAGRL